MKKAAEKCNEKFNRSRKLHFFKEGDQVMAEACNFFQKSEKIMGKLLSFFEGPYIIHKQVGPSIFILQHLDDPIERGMYNSSELKPYVSRITNQ